MRHIAWPDRHALHQRPAFVASRLRRGSLRAALACRAEAPV